jgi:hypothetical protein
VEEWRGEVIYEIAAQISKLDQKPLTNSEKYVIIAGRPLKGKRKRPRMRRTGITNRSSEKLGPPPGEKLGGSAGKHMNNCISNCDARVITHR